MSNVTIYPTKYEDTYNEEVKYGVRIVGLTQQAYVDNWTIIPPSDEEILARVVRTVTVDPWPAMLAAVISSKSGIIINGVYFDYLQILNA